MITSGKIHGGQQSIWATLAILIACLFTSPSFAEASAPVLQAAADKFFQGHIASAIKSLRPLADQALKDPASPSGKVTVEYLLDVCTGAWDYDCLQLYAPQYSKLVQAIPNVPEALKLPFALRPIYYASVLAWLTGDHAFAAGLLKDWPETIEAPWAPREYIPRQLARARLYFLLGNTDAARICVDRALMSIASVENPGSSLREITSWLTEAVEDLLELGDSERAIGLSLTNGAVGQKLFAPRSIEYFRLLNTSAEVYVAANMIPQAKDASERALNVLSLLEIDPRIRIYISSEAETNAALICVFASDLKCAQEHIAHHPFAAGIPQIESRGFLQSPQEVSYFAARALISALSKKPVDPKESRLLSTPMRPTVTLPAEVMDASSVYRQFGHAIASLREHPDDAKAELRAATPELLHLESEKTDQVGFLPRRSLIDQLVISMALMASQGGNLDAKSGDDVVRLIELFTRNGQAFSSESLALMSRARTDTVRNDIRELLRLRSHRDTAERAEIARVLSVKPTLEAGKPPQQPSVNFTRRNIYSDYATLIHKALERLKTAQPDLVVADFPPTLDEVQKSLGDNEVVVGAPLLTGGLLGHLCISRSMVRFTTEPAPSAALVADIRILDDSLSSQNAPSDELDRQYPISAARELYNVLLKPSEGCLLPGNRVAWVGMGIDGVPLSALLTDGQPSDLEALPLAQWPWFVKTFSSTQVFTLSSLVAMRHSPRTVTAGLSTRFLGIGDPHFAGLAADSQEIVASAPRGGIVANGVATLPPLPDTRAEIEQVASHFPNQPTLLLGDQATEASLRRLPLEQYGYIEFATHGLVRQDIAGLTEAALALTPVTAADTFDDGLLTAPEIADLPLHARFVALSACNTALSDSTKFASEIPGLASAFQAAGVPATLATLWPVESDASKRIVEETFQSVIENHDGPAIALAQAQRDYLAHSPTPAHQHPRFWAPFVMYGDGTTTTISAPGGPSVQLEEARLLTTSGGEVSSVSKDASGALTLHAMGDVQIGHRHSGLTARLRNDMSVEWKNADPTNANAALALAVGNETLLGGYRGGGDTPTVATIHLVDDIGTAKESWELPLSNADAFPIGGLLLGSQHSLIAVLSHARNAQPDGKWPDDHIVIADVRFGHPLTITADVVLPSHSFTSFSGMQKLGKDVLLIATDNAGSTLPKSYFNEYHQITSCGLESHSSLMLLQQPKMALEWKSKLPNVQFTSAQAAADGSVWLVGNVSAGCGEGLRMSLWRLSKDKVLTNVFTDHGPRESAAHSMMQRADGSIVLLGLGHRTTDVQSLEERDPQQTVRNAGQTERVSFSTRYVDDAVLILLSSKFDETARYTLRSGSDIWIAGALTVGGNTWLYGALGNQAALMRVSGL